MNLGQMLASKGRFGDTMLAHITPEEAKLLKRHGGSGTINPETGLPEYWKGWKKIRKLAKVALPIAGTLLAPGIGTALGSTLSGAALSGIGGALGGGVGGAMDGGGLSGALKGAALGGASGYLSGGGLTQLAPETSNALFNSTGGLIGSSSGNVNAGIGSLLGLSGSGNSVLGTAAGTPLSGGLQGATQGTGLAGFGTRALSAIGSPASSALSGAGVGGGSSIFGGSGGLGTALGGAYSLYSNEQAQDDLEKAGNNALGILSPYTQSGAAANSQLSDKLASGELGGAFNPGDLTQDPGYQFNLQQGQEALDRSQAARGNFFSGAALKEAQTFGQGLADNTFNNAYERWLKGQQNTYGMLAGQAGQGLGAANSSAGLTTDIGSARANAQMGTSNIINQSLASLLAGRGRQYAWGN